MKLNVVCNSWIDILLHADLRLKKYFETDSLLRQNYILLKVRLIFFTDVGEKVVSVYFSLWAKKLQNSPLPARDK